MSKKIKVLGSPYGLFIVLMCIVLYYYAFVHQSENRAWPGLKLILYLDYILFCCYPKCIIQSATKMGKSKCAKTKIYSFYFYIEKKKVQNKIPLGRERQEMEKITLYKMKEIH